MAARQKYPTSHEQLGLLMIEARRAGLSFDVFWDRAVRPGRAAVTFRTPVPDRPIGCIVWPNDTENRARDRAIYADELVREGWRRAYERAPAERRDTALLRLEAFLEAA